jgi:Tfp pilus assembly protein PilZ
MIAESFGDQLEIDVLSISIRDKRDLSVVYMPFVVSGGLFVPTARECQVGVSVLVVSK